MVLPVQVIYKNQKFSQKEFDFQVVAVILFGGIIIACNQPF